MTARMKIAGTACAIGEIALRFQYFLDDGPPHAWLDIHSDSTNDGLAGVAINALDIGDIPLAAGIHDRTFAFDQGDSEAGIELGESVFWTENQKTLEISSLRLRFGSPSGARLPLTIDATCFDHEGGQDIAVSIEGSAVLSSR